MKNIIQVNHLGVIFKQYNTVKLVAPGKVLTSIGRRFMILRPDSSFQEQGFDLDRFYCTVNKDVVETVIVPEDTIMVRYVDGIRKGIYTSGKYYFVQVNATYQIFSQVDLDFSSFSYDLIQALEKLQYAKKFKVDDGCVGVLYVNGKKEKVLDPGMYAFNTYINDVSVVNYHLKVNTITPTNQELLTKDKVTIRVNFYVNYKITQLGLILDTYDNIHTVLYNVVQIAIRSYIGQKTLDEILNEKNLIGETILQQLQATEEQYGVSFIEVGVKDIILPGEIRDILNTVLIAEKKAQANVITRREETASTRSLLNTAKLMEDNQTLYRLKELEIIERIFDKVGNINLSSGNMLDNLTNLIGSRDKNTK